MSVPESAGCEEEPTAGESVKPKQQILWLVKWDINTDECCACFGLYSEDFGTGQEWLQCACGSWIHKECVEDNVVYDVNEAMPSVPNSSLTIDNVFCGSEMKYIVSL